MNTVTLLTLVLSAVTVTIRCQTFQYSRGWTNGKRATLANSPQFLANIAADGHPIQESDRSVNNFILFESDTYLILNSNLVLIRLASCVCPTVTGL